MKKSSSWVFVFILSILVLAGCVQSDYTKLVKRELSKNVRYDSLFLTFRFNDTRTEFFTKGWEQNRLGLIRQGPSNQNVEYMMNSQDSTKSGIQMLFFPEFDDQEQIKKMELFFRYRLWSPTSSRFSSKDLLPATMDTLMSWYGGNEFLEVKFNQDSVSLWVKVDGNRQISLSPVSESEVKAIFSDLTWVKPKEQEVDSSNRSIGNEDENM
jgi:hypothetical protein